MLRILPSSLSLLSIILILCSIHPYPTSCAKTPPLPIYGNIVISSNILDELINGERDQIKNIRSQGFRWTISYDKPRDVFLVTKDSYSLRPAICLLYDEAHISSTEFGYCVQVFDPVLSNNNLTMIDFTVVLTASAPRMASWRRDVKWYSDRMRPVVNTFELELVNIPELGSFFNGNSPLFNGNGTAMVEGLIITFRKRMPNAIRRDAFKGLSALERFVLRYEDAEKEGFGDWDGESRGVLPASLPAYTVMRSPPGNVHLHIPIVWNSGVQEREVEVLLPGVYINELFFNVTGMDGQVPEGLGNGTFFKLMKLRFENLGEMLVEKWEESRAHTADNAVGSDFTTLFGRVENLELSFSSAKSMKFCTNLPKNFFSGVAGTDGSDFGVELHQGRDQTFGDEQTAVSEWPCDVPRAAVYFMSGIVVGDDLIRSISRNAMAKSRVSLREVEWRVTDSLSLGPSIRYLDTSLASTGKQTEVAWALLGMNLTMAVGLQSLEVDCALSGERKFWVDLPRNSRIKSLNLRQCHLFAKGKMSLQASLDWSNVFFLSISEMDISSLYRKLFPCHFTGLDGSLLSRNHSQVASCCENTSAIRYLKIVNATDGLFPKELRKDMLCQSKSLMYLSLQKNGITSIEDGVFDELETVHLIDVSDNRIQSLPRMLLANRTNVFSLDFSKNLIHTLPSPLCFNSTWHFLGLSFNQLSSFSVSKVFHRCVMSASTGLSNDPYSVLSKLDLSHNQISHTLSLEMEALWNASNVIYDLRSGGGWREEKHTSKALTFNVSNNNLTGIEVWQKNPDLRLDAFHFTFDFSHNQIVHLKHSKIENVTNLYRLDLSHNRIKVLSNDDMLLKNSCFLVGCFVDMSYNELEDIQQIQRLFLNSSLLSFDVGYNRLRKVPHAITSFPLRLPIFTLVLDEDDDGNIGTSLTYGHSYAYLSIILRGNSISTIDSTLCGEQSKFGRTYFDLSRCNVSLITTDVFKCSESNSDSSIALNLNGNANLKCLPLSPVETGMENNVLLISVVNTGVTSFGTKFKVKYGLLHSLALGPTLDLECHWVRDRLLKHLRSTTRHVVKLHSWRTVLIVR